MTFSKRSSRRRTAATIAAAAAAASLMSVGAVVVASDEAGNDHAIELNNAEDATNHYHYTHPPELRRHLAQSSAEAFASWTSDKVAKAQPLDLKLDESTGEVYVATLNGYLEPYVETFERIANGENVQDEYWDGVLDAVAIITEADKHVVSAHDDSASERLYYKILDKDGIPWPVTSQKNLLRGQRETGERKLNEAAAADDAVVVSIHLDSIEFFGADSVELGTRSLAAAEAADYFEDDQEEAEYYIEDEEEDDIRSLQEEEDSSSSSGNSPRMRANNNNRKKNKKKNKNKNNGGRNNNNKQNNNNGNKKKLPKIDRITPSNGDTISNKQTFSARIQPSVVTNSPVDKVTFQLIDHNNQKSDWLTVPEVGSNNFEITVDGFDRYPGTQWSFALQAKDANGKRRTTDSIPFKIEGVGNSGNGFANNGSSTPEGPGGRAPPAPSPNNNASSKNDNNNKKTEPMPQTYESDSNWPYPATTIQSSTGRIMFEFDNSGQTFVCSGTVVCDGANGTPDTSNGRSVIQTAAHCAYNDIMKKFATKAIFIPDQDSTRGDKSDFDCKNDRYGCWHLSFAVAAEGWTKGSFPTNVPFDYAYYTVYDDPSTHTGGYTNGLTGILDKDVPCVRIDFDFYPNNEFIFSIGYSADKDPNLRHCAMENTKINGVSWYTNLWLDDCAMTGGASGGPWVHDMDEEGTGTLVSVNSWGFTHKPGMAGPVFKTSSGSWAECLFEKAKRSNDPGWRGGIIVDDC